MALLDREAVIDITDSKLRSGWCIISGASDVMIALEDQVYTPGTPANSDFMAFMLPLFPPRPLYLARKTDRLKKLLLAGGLIPDADWQRMSIISFDSAIAGKDIVHATAGMLRDLSGMRKLAELAVSGGIR